MSRAKRIPDVERTATMLDLLRRRTEGSGSQMTSPRIMLEECAPGTGTLAARFADALVLGVWPSGGFRLDGYEVKASRADLRKELANPAKHLATAKYCDTWSLIAWDEKVIAGFDVPDHWGVYVTVDAGDGVRALKRVRNPQRFASPAPWSKAFVASMVRNAYQQAPGAAWVARAILEAAERSKRDGKEEATRDVMKKLRDASLALKKAVDGAERTWGWSWGSSPEELAKLMTDAAVRLEANGAYQDGLAVGLGVGRNQLEQIAGRDAKGAANGF